MPSNAYHTVLQMTRELPLEEQLQLLEDLVRFIRQQASLKRKHSILELEGLGKEIWEGVDVAKYIDEERNSWE